MITDEIQRKLVEAAGLVRLKAYTPYSGYQVGAALMTVEGIIFTGCNIENAAYSPGICAERAAVAKAVSEGFRRFSAIAVVTSNGGAPCGICRQVMFEFAPQMPVIIANMDAEVLLTQTVAELLPHAFGPEALGYDTP